MPGPDERLRDALHRAAAPADPAGAYEQIVRKRGRFQVLRRAQIVGLVIVVLAGTIGGSLALVRVFRSDDRGSPAAGGSVSPTHPPVSPSSLPDPSPTQTPTPAWPLPECATSWVNGDFDGNGRLDTAAVCDQPGGKFSLNVQWAGGAGGAVSLPDCEAVCQAKAVSDLNGDGKDEFILLIRQGASTEFVEVFELPPSEAFGRPSRVRPPGSKRYPAGEPAVFALGGSVTHQDGIDCSFIDGRDRVWSAHAILSRDRTQWLVEETVLTFRPTATPPFGEFIVNSTRDFDISVEEPVLPEGTWGSCWSS